MVDELTVEHTRLFTSDHEPVALRESAYLPEGDPTTEIQDFLDGQGLSPGRSNLEPDHLRAQLSAAADLARRERGTTAPVTSPVQWLWSSR